MALWFRSWHGAPTDPKWLTISKRTGVLPGIVSAIWFALEDYASQQNDRGSIAGFDVEDYAAFSGFAEDDISVVLTAFEQKGITKDERLTNWEKRQPQREDDSANRVREWRARQQAPLQDTVTHGNAAKRAVTRANTPETDTDTETEREEKTDTEQTDPEDGNSSNNKFAADLKYLEQYCSGTLTPTLRDQFLDIYTDLEERGLTGWVRMAVDYAVAQNKQNYAYVMAILRGCLRENHPPGQRRNGRERRRQDDMSPEEESVYLRNRYGTETRGT